MLVYWANIFLAGVPLYFSWMCPMGAGLVRDDIPREVAAAIKRRIVIAQACMHSARCSAL